MEKFNVPVVLFIFKRKEKIKQIIDKIKEVQPKKIYILGDGPRNEEEIEIVNACRKATEASITWECEIIKNYSEKNRGVYENIAEGAKWVFEREKMAIFLEDDNLPEKSFFYFCEELLKKYENDERILWICGTNYLEKFNTPSEESYVFTKHLMPCGWASWGNKFNKFYDGDLRVLDNDLLLKDIKVQYENKSLFRQQLESAMLEKKRMINGKKPRSWDYQMAISIRSNSVYGISPKYNLIKNIGVDNDSIHGGNSLDNEMTRRFCTIQSYEIELPLKHPKHILSNLIYEKKVAKIILLPLSYRIKGKIIKLIKKILKIDFEISLSEKIKILKKFK